MFSFWYNLKFYTAMWTLPLLKSKLGSIDEIFYLVVNLQQPIQLTNYLKIFLLLIILVYLFCFLF